MPDSSFSFDTRLIGEGAHTIQVTFTNSTATRTTTHNFTNNLAATPDVNLSTNIGTIINLTIPVVLTATNGAGGGPTPLYTFAKDRNFSIVLQTESANFMLTVDPATLSLGENWLYVKMKTSLSCFTSSTNIDSIKLIRDQSTGISDPDFPNQTINIYPNPFGRHLNVSGLQPAKIYSILIHGNDGRLFYKDRIRSNASVSFQNLRIPAGLYLLSIYDEKRNRLLGSVKIIKE